MKGQQKKAVAITSAMGSASRHDGAALIYRSSKAALNNAMKGLSVALKSDGLTVVAMHPGWVKTDMGGASAPLTPERAVAAMRKTIASLTSGDTGEFINYDGAKISF
jgi:NAD(P)-dependent dehydrogenase (short-subunit alcohol dehydrogenase family)